jgi:hypothetical protein
MIRVWTPEVAAFESVAAGAFAGGGESVGFATPSWGAMQSDETASVMLARRIDI